VELCTGHFTLSLSLLDGWQGRLSPLDPPPWPPPTATVVAVGALASGQLPPTFLFLFLLLPLPWRLPPPWA
jgi:hypothetical protein